MFFVINRMAWINHPLHPHNLLLASKRKRKGIRSRPFLQCVVWIKAESSDIVLSKRRRATRSNTQRVSPSTELKNETVGWIRHIGRGHFVRATGALTWKPQRDTRFRLLSECLAVLGRVRPFATLNATASPARLILSNNG